MQRVVVVQLKQSHKKKKPVFHMGNIPLKRWNRGTLVALSAPWSLLLFIVLRYKCQRGGINKSVASPKGIHTLFSFTPQRKDYDFLTTSHKSPRVPRLTLPFFAPRLSFQTELSLRFLVLRQVSIGCIVKKMKSLLTLTCLVEHSTDKLAGIQERHSKTFFSHFWASFILLLLPPSGRVFHCTACHFRIDGQRQIIWG